MTILHVSTTSCDLGHLLVATNQTGICAIFIGDDTVTLKHTLKCHYSQLSLIDSEDAQLAALCTTLANFIHSPTTSLSLPLDIQGTAFQKRVWQAIANIPIGTTASYTDIANHIGTPQAVRAVANACAANQLAIAIPCHRVIRHNGMTSGYRWGNHRKNLLLQREANALS